MKEYLALAVYAGFAFTIFVGGILWNKYRQMVKRRLNLQEEYRHRHTEDHRPA